MELDNVTKLYMKEQQEHRQTQGDLADLLEEYEVQTKELARVQSELVTLQDKTTASQSQANGTFVKHDRTDTKNFEFSFDATPMKSDINT